ncbi:MAG TPA: hypothetical protein VM848_16490 [Acidimicrobiia bacterium]|nr:hypothetical protein [Acidimicrobiia bacterium]
MSRSATLVADGLALNPTQRLALQTTFSNGSYGQIAADVEFQKSRRSLQGPIFVVGDPVYYWLADRRHAIVQRGWTLEYYFPEQWRAMAAEVDSPLPVYVFVSHD